MAVGKGHELLGHEEDADADAAEDILLVLDVGGLGVDPLDQVLDLMHKGGGDRGRGHFWRARPKNVVRAREIRRQFFFNSTLP